YVRAGGADVGRVVARGADEAVGQHTGLRVLLKRRRRQDAAAVARHAEVHGHDAGQVLASPAYRIGVVDLGRIEPGVGLARQPLLVQRVLAEVGQDAPGPTGAFRERGFAGGGQAVVLVVVHVAGQADLLDVVGAVGAVAGLAHLLH